MEAASLRGCLTLLQRHFGRKRHVINRRRGSIKVSLPSGNHFFAKLPRCTNGAQARFRVFPRCTTVHNGAQRIKKNILSNDFLFIAWQPCAPSVHRCAPWKKSCAPFVHRDQTLLFLKKMTSEKELGCFMMFDPSLSPRKGQKWLHFLDLEKLQPPKGPFRQDFGPFLPSCLSL